jgi:hypothetical protein
MVYQASLAQAEELWDAAAAAGPASRPLPLFYCVSQAGRAICAAWSLAEEWRPKGHGLRRHISEDPGPAKRVFAHAVSVDNRPLGIYPMVVDATRSVRFVGQASVAELWESLPGFPTPSAEIAGNPPRALRLERARRRLADPRNLAELLAAPTRAVIRSHYGIPVEQLPDIYPTMTGIEQDGTQPDMFGGEDPVYRFSRGDGSFKPLHEIGARPVEDGRSLDRFVVRPKIGTESIGPPSEFLTLWPLLFCLSELARYYPDTWVRALDPDESRAAVTIEAGLDFALERVPSLIFQGLRGPIDFLMAEELRRREEEAAAAVGEDEGAPAEE